MSRGTTQTMAGMILLEPGNRVLASTVETPLRWTPTDEKDAGPGQMDVKMCDFDNVDYEVTMGDDNQLHVNMKLPCYPAIEDQGVKASLEAEYKGILETPKSGFDVALCVDIQQHGQDVDELIQNISLLKSKTLGALFMHHFRPVMSSGPPADNFKVDIRPDTTVFFTSKPGRCTVIFSLDFNERVDRAVAKVFLQEFQESRRHLGAAPPCIFSLPDNPPMELEAFGCREPTDRETHVGYLSFAVLPSHVKTETHLLRVADTLQTFRNYLQYHIKCSKAYFHSRMRARVVSLLKVLNRAKMEPEDKAKKTFSGKRFVQK